MSDIINSPKAPAAIGPYVQARTAGSLIFTSGQLGMDAEGNLPADFEAQARLSLENVKAILEAGGSSMAKVIKSTVFLSDMNNFAVFNKLYTEYFQSPCPARSCVQVARLPKDAAVEMEVIAQR